MSFQVGGTLSRDDNLTDFTLPRFSKAFKGRVVIVLHNTEIIEPGLLIASLYCKYDKSIFHTQSNSDVLTDRQTWREDAGLPINIKKRVEFMLQNFMFHLRGNPEL